MKALQSAVLWSVRQLMLATLIFNVAFADTVVLPVHPFVVTGVVKESGNARLLQDFVNYLSRRSDYPLRLVYTDSYRGLSEQLRNNPMAVGWACGAPFVEDHVTDGQQLVTVPLFQGAPTYHSLLIARHDPGKQHLLDFSGAVFAYSDPRSNSGFIVPAFQLKQAGQDIHRFFRLLLPAGTHEHSIEAVRYGLADVATVDEYVWVEYLRSHPQVSQKLTVLERYGPYPFTPVVAGRSVTPAVTARLQKALTSMATDTEGRALIERFHLDGFVRRPVTFYRPIADMLQSLGVISKGWGSGSH